MEQCIIEKTGLNGNFEEELRKNKEKIEQLQELNKNLEQYIKKKKENENNKDVTRFNNLKGLLEKPLSTWTSMNRQTAVELGKFKDWKEAEEWIRKHQ